MSESSKADAAPLIDRREVIRRVSALLGVVGFVGGTGLSAALERGDVAAGRADVPAGTSGIFTADQVALLDEIAETILPATKTPGAKAAQTGAFMALMVTDCYSSSEQQVFHTGLRQVDAAMRQAHTVSFMEASPAQRLALLVALDREQHHLTALRKAAGAGRASKDDEPPVPYFRMMKELAMLGFFTSKVGCTQALRYIETPGRYDPCVPYTAGEPAWALHA